MSVWVVLLAVVGACALVALVFVGALYAWEFARLHWAGPRHVADVDRWLRLCVKRPPRSLWRVVSVHRTSLYVIRWPRRERP